MADKKCSIYGKKLERPPLGAPSFSRATGYSSLENLAPIKPVTLVCPEKGWDYRDVEKDQPLSGSGGSARTL